MKEQRVNIVEVKSKAFALRIVKLYQYLRDRKETVLSKAARSPTAATGVIMAVTLLIALTTSLAVGYIRTSRALAATEHEAENIAER